jgi:hypothetical protein
MRMSDIPFGTTDWTQVAPTEHKGERGYAYRRTQHFGAHGEAHRSYTVRGAKLFVVD